MFAAKHFLRQPILHDNRKVFGFAERRRIVFVLDGYCIGWLAECRTCKEK
jgi:hypothetical protein